MSEPNELPEITIEERSGGSLGKIYFLYYADVDLPGCWVSNTQGSVHIQTPQTFLDLDAMPYFQHLLNRAIEIAKQLELEKTT